VKVRYQRLSSPPLYSLFPFNILARPPSTFTFVLNIVKLLESGSVVGGGEHE